DDRSRRHVEPPPQQDCGGAGLHQQALPRAGDRAGRLRTSQDARAPRRCDRRVWLPDGLATPTTRIDDTCVNLAHCPAGSPELLSQGGVYASQECRRNWRWDAGTWWQDTPDACRSAGNCASWSVVAGVPWFTATPGASRRPVSTIQCRRLLLPTCT